jgi:hypothetical protein
MERNNIIAEIYWLSYPGAIEKSTCFHVLNFKNKVQSNGREGNQSSDYRGWWLYRGNTTFVICLMFNLID